MWSGHWKILVTIMAPMSFSNLHTHFKLGALLVFAAVLLHAGGSGAFWTFIASDRLGLLGSQYLWLSVAAGLGGLSLVAAVIWVDSRPPHRMMVVGALVLAIGLALLTLADSFGLAVVAAVIAGAGGAAVGSLIFYAVAVKGRTRFKGMLIGVMSLVFSVRWDADYITAWGASLPIGWFAVILVLAGGALLFALLPRWFTGPDGSGQTLRETVAVPGTKVLIFWVAVVYLVSTMILAGGTTHLWYVVRDMSTGTDSGFGRQITALVGGIGALVWGISADFFPVRWLLTALAVLSLPALGCLWLLGGQSAGVLLLWLVLGGLISLPWVLMAESLPENHFAKLALGITWVGLLGSSLGPLWWGLALDVWNTTDAFLWVVVAEMTVLVAVVAYRPRLRRTGT